MRHGKQDIPSGSFTPALWTDPPLSDLGRRQAAAVGAAFADAPLDAVLCSHLVRALETARHIAAPHGLEPVVYPEHLTEELDYELELAVVISKAGKWFGPEEAADYIGGFVIFNDITARDIQRREMRSGVFSFCKGIDTFCPLGPWIVTPDEIGDPHDLQMTLRVNGESRQESHSGNMSVTIPEILSHYSALGYSAGDVVSTGTVSGVAGFSEDAASLYLKPGDVIEAEIEKIGILRNPVISWQDAHGEPAPPRVAF